MLATSFNFFWGEDKKKTVWYMTKGSQREREGLWGYSWRRCWVEACAGQDEEGLMVWIFNFKLVKGSVSFLGGETEMICKLQR